MTRMYNEKCDQAGIDAEWAALPAALREMLAPFRADDAGMPAVRFRVGAFAVEIDVIMIAHAGRNDAGMCLKFILDEVMAFAEGVLTEKAA